MLNLPIVKALPRCLKLSWIRADRAKSGLRVVAVVGINLPMLRVAVFNDYL